MPLTSSGRSTGNSLNGANEAKIKQQLVLLLHTIKHMATIFSRWFGLTRGETLGVILSLD